MKKFVKARAFTLAELLMAVLVISIIMVALAPVITRRMSDNIAIEVNSKKGLEIFTNPGSYTFDVPIGINTLFIQGAAGGGGGAGTTYVDKSISFTSNTNWTVPKGVNQLTFTITGSGGGGGAGNGKANSGTEEFTTEAIPKTTCLDDEVLVMRGADDGRDFCIPKQNLSRMDLLYARMDFTDPNTTCTSGECCWKHIDNGINRHACMRSSTELICYAYKMAIHANGNLARAGLYRLPTAAEYARMTYYNNSDSGFLNKINFCDGRNLPNDIVPGCASGGRSGYFGPCNGSSGNSCAPYCYHVVEKGLAFCFHGSGGSHTNGFNDFSALSTRCIRPIDRYIRYSGAGGASGAQLQRTINVLPDDVLAISIGEGGNGGSYDSNRSNGLSERKGNGAQGSLTKITHKRNSVSLGVYYVYGGFGGFGATASANGNAITNGSSSGQTSQWLCQIQKNGASSSSIVPCTTISYSGNGGSSTSGGNGGRVKNSGTATSGGIYYVSPLCNEGLIALSGPYSTSDCGANTRLSTQRNTTAEANYAKGQAATIAGFGGGGGLTPAWASSSSHFFSGGKGANGKIDIVYRVALPGGGGGSGTRVGGVNESNKEYKIVYKVNEGDRIVFKIGQGGSGGVSGQEGLSGSATVVGDNDIVFLGGEGGKISTDLDKSSLIGGRGGLSGYINENDEIENISLGLKIKGKTNPTEFSINPPMNSFLGNDGRRGGVPDNSYVVNNTIWAYGFSGGIGGAPFGIRNNSASASISCGGGIYGVLGTVTDTKSYLCTSGNINGNNARSHDPVNNEFGGSGGGGGGVLGDSFELGSGGNGSSGYLRIRWDESQNED